MIDYILILATSTWLGVLTSISPCPLATNIAAISYIGRKSEHRRYVLISGLLYTAGRILTYVIIATIIVSSLLAVPAISNFLQTQMNKFLGPILILVGMLLLGWLSLNLKGLGVNDKLQRGADRFGVLSALPLGALFALSFCPVSAALFFGSLVPLALNHGSRFVIPSLYGVGTSIPVIIFAFIMAFAAHLVGKAFHKITKIEIWMRKITGVIFILVGIYFSLVYIFGVSI